jgi:hypothetical protein
MYIYRKFIDAESLTEAYVEIPLSKGDWLVAAWKNFAIDFFEEVKDETEVLVSSNIFSILVATKSIVNRSQDGLIGYLSNGTAIKTESGGFRVAKGIYTGEERFSILKEPYSYRFEKDQVNHLDEKH